jgi:hypothetical protein
VQERKEDDPDFGVVLAKPLKKGETTSDSHYVWRQGRGG